MNLLWRRFAIVCLALLGLSAPGFALWHGLQDSLGVLFWAWTGLGLALAWSALAHLQGHGWRHLMVLFGLAGCLVTSTWQGPFPVLAYLSASLGVLSTAALAGVVITRDRSRPPNLMDYYSAAVKARRVRPDQQQLLVVEQLDQLAERYIAYEQRRHLPWAGLLSPPRGVYLHGPAGRGKSFLLDGMFDVSNSAVKTRFHYHELMSGLNAQINASDSRGVRSAANRLAARASLIVIDEVNVLDVASVVLFVQLVEAWWARGCVVCMSSNQAPEALFSMAQSNGEASQRFLDRLLAKAMVLPLTQGEDYRLQKLAATDLYQTPITDATLGNMRRIVELLAESDVSNEPVQVGQREMPVQLQASAVAWFDFATVCGAAYSYEDYLSLVARYPTLLVSNVPQIRNHDEARRFAWLVEIVYDAKQRLVLSATVPREALFADNVISAAQETDYVKITSRLAEMASSEYNYTLAQE